MGKTLASKTFKGLGDLIKLLPTGTVFLFQFLNPLLTNNGQCREMNKILSSVLLVLCGFSCSFACFTDSYRGSNGKLYYGIVTARGLYPLWDPHSAAVDLSKYKLRTGDFVHAALSAIVFATVSLLDSNTVSCFYPSFESQQKLILMTLPTAIGTVATATFVVFPNDRHGIGYPPSPDAASSPLSSSSSPVD
ncbi:transmembrane protein, putative (DUF679 domain membrane protein 2) [Wolffia australiana]